MRILGRAILWTLFAVALLPLPALAKRAVGEPERPMKPKILKSLEGTFHCDTPPTLLVGRSLEGADASALLPLQTTLQSHFDSPISAAHPNGKLPTSPFILVGLAQDHPALKQLVADHQSELPKEGLGPEGYLLDITPERILLTAAKPAGVLYGARKLAERNTEAQKGLTIPAGVVADWPAMAWRGIHLLVNGRQDLPALETLLTQVMPQYRYNQLILEINYHFQFQSHPEVREGDVLTRDDCRYLKEVADKSFIRLIPMINCLGHQSWAEHTAQLLKTHPEFDETPDYPADNKGIYCRSWCPSNPDVNKLVNDLMDEMIDAFDAKAFHVGMDEVFILGECPRCKGQDHDKLFAKAVADLHAHLVGKRKIEMLMWGDRLLDGKTTGYGEWEASENGTAPAIDRIPKDIVLCDWHYETRYKGAPATYPSVPYFQEKGLRVWPSGWRSDENVQMLTAVSLQNRTDKMIGYLATTWSDVRPIVAGLSGGVQPSGKEAAGVVGAVKKGAQIAWEGSDTTP